MFDDPRSYLWLIPALPLAASVLTAFLGSRFLRQQSHWPCVLAAAASFILSVMVLVAVSGAKQESGTIQTYYTWIQAGSLVQPPGEPEARPAFDIGFTLRADGLTAIMLVTVTFVGGLIAVYSAGYMRGDPGYARYFAEISLFLFAMTGLVLADNFILLYAFWEGVGLCSYLLIGFWFTKPSAADAARKAFLVTRIGDVGMLIGIILLWSQFSENGNVYYALNFDQIFDSLSSAVPEGEFSGPLTAVCLLLFCGAVGKSAQFPLHVWLPDAMEGPSPVSALIHAATMVTAGVYLVARCTPLFVLAPHAQLVVACIGAFTALLAALMALTQTDLKRVLAYSTISQLGYMFLALGSATFGGWSPIVAAIFHLFTHAFFKALLFLSAGSVMHAMGNVIDMRRFSGLRRILPTTHLTFLCGAAALAGIPLLSGFWSKDEILATTAQATHTGPYKTLYLVLLVSALVTAALTAFYTFRDYFLTFWGEERIPPEAGHHAHESPPVMLVPMIILAIGAVGIGIVFQLQPIAEWFTKLLRAKHEGMNWLLMVISSLLALAGLGLAWFLYVRRPALADELARKNERLYELSRNRFYLDDLYNIFIVRPASGLAAVCRVLDHYLVDGLVDLFGQVPRFLGILFRPIQNGLVQFYALAMVLGLAVFLLSLLMR
jgi:NADH-quinone oxidoreductase subunit L